MSQQLLDYGDGIYAVDADYVRPLLAAIHLIVDDGRVAVVDTGTQAALPRIEQALTALGLGWNDVEYVILTHVHLDHAAAAGPLMQRVPNAKLVVHPRGVRHMVDPRQLWAAVREVYGAEAVQALYGDPIAVPSERIVAAVDALRLNLGSRTLELLETPGHARHHICIRDGASGSVFTGDVFGMSYRELDEPAPAGASDADEGLRRFIFPTTSPSQFDPIALHRSIDRVLALQPPALFLTHFGRVRSVPSLGERLHRMIDGHVAVALNERDRGADRQTEIRAGLAWMLLEELRVFGSKVSQERALELMAVDLKLNAQGLVCWLDSIAQRDMAVEGFGR